MSWKRKLFYLIFSFAMSLWFGGGLLAIVGEVGVSVKPIWTLIADLYIGVLTVVMYIALVKGDKY